MWWQHSLLLRHYELNPSQWSSDALETRNLFLCPVTAISCLLFVDVSGEHYRSHDPRILMIFNQATNLVKGFTNTNTWWESTHIYYYLFHFDCLLFEIPSFSMIATMKPFVNNKTEFSTKQILQEVGLRDTDGQLGSAIINFVPGLHSKPFSHTPEWFPLKLMIFSVFAFPSYIYLKSVVVTVNNSLWCWTTNWPLVRWLTLATNKVRCPLLIFSFHVWFWSTDKTPYIYRYGNVFFIKRESLLIVNSFIYCVALV